MNRHQDAQFMTYIQALEPILAAHGEHPHSEKFQANQVNRLVAMEASFRRYLVRHPRGMDAYRAFISQCKNILTARPYFRERDETFKSSISKALKEKDPVALTRFNINRMFIEFVLKLGWWEPAQVTSWVAGLRAAGTPPDSAFVKLARYNARKLLDVSRRHLKLRDDLVECNLPLAISQARSFYGHNQQSHLAYMDFNQIGAIGLMNAIDKFSGPWTDAFRNVAVYRMKGDFIEENSQTFVHFYPQERKVLYRVRKILRTMPKEGQEEYDYVEVHRRLNAQEVEHKDKLTGFSEMLHILSASRVIQANSLMSEEEESQGDNIDKYPDASENRPDMLLEQAEAHRAVSEAIRLLPVFDRKLLVLRGIESL